MIPRKKRLVKPVKIGPANRWKYGGKRKKNNETALASREVQQSAHRRLWDQISVARVLVVLETAHSLEIRRVLFFVAVLCFEI